MADAVDDALAALEARAAELRSELARLEGAIAALTGSRRPGRRGARPASSARKAARSAPARRAARKRGRPKGSGARAQQAAKAVTKNPGASTAVIASKLGMASPNYLYRVLPQLEKDGVIVKRDGGWHPA